MPTEYIVELVRRAGWLLSQDQSYNQQIKNSFNQQVKSFDAPVSIKGYFELVDIMINGCERMGSR
jgi:hypothetical protein